MSEELKVLQELKASVGTMQATLQGKAEEALKEAKNAGQISQELKNQIDPLLSDLNADRQRLNDLEVQLGEAEKAFASLPNGGKPVAAQTIGQTFAADQQWQNFAANAAKSSQCTSVRLDVNAAITSFDDAGKQWTPGRDIGFIPTQVQRLTVRDLLPWISIEENSVNYLREAEFVNGANTAAEGTLKGESSIKFEEDTAQVVTIAHWMLATKQVLSDFKMLAGYIDQRLGYGLKLKEENQLLKGSGVGVNINGLITQAAAYNNQGVVVTNETPLDRLRLSLLQIELENMYGEGFVLHPTDWASIELLKDTQNRYLFANPFGLTIPSLWGLPVVSTTSQTKGDFLTGAFRQAAQGYDRETMSVEVFNQDRDNVVKNMVTILVEERIGLQVLRPEAFVKGALKGMP